MKHRYTFFTLFLILFSLPMVAQITFLIPDKKVVKDGFVDAEIRLKTRDSLTALQFTIEWNPTILEFVEIGGIALAGVTVQESFGLNNIYDGNFKFLWISSASDGVRVADSAMIFKIKYKAIGIKGAISKVKFTSSQIRLRALNPRVDTIPITAREGTITIEGSSAVGEVSDTEGSIILHQNTPNPIVNQTVIPFELRESQVINLKIYDIVGRMVYDKSSFFNNGKQEWALDTEGVLQKGIYLYSLKTNKGIVTRTMVKN
jgi:Secretion system C-terminal sorting domain/Cohesin domain